MRAFNLVVALCITCTFGVVEDFVRTEEEGDERAKATKLVFTKPCFMGYWFKDGPKIVTDLDVTLFADGGRGIPAENTAHCESLCLQFSECTCFIYDLKMKRCNLKYDCIAERRGSNRYSKKFMNACMFQRPPQFMQCTAGPGEKACRNGCEHRGLHPDCTCGAPGKLGPVEGFAGPWCESKDICHGKQLGESCGVGGECKQNDKGVVECTNPCLAKVDGDSCSSSDGEGKCKYDLWGHIQCHVRKVDVCTLDDLGASCPGGSCSQGFDGKMVCLVPPCENKQKGDPCTLVNWNGAKGLCELENGKLECTNPCWETNETDTC